MVKKEVEHIYVNVPSWTGKNIVQNAPWMGAAMEAEGILSSLDATLAEFGGIGFSSQLGALEQVTMSYGKLEGAVKYLPDVIRKFIDVPLMEALGRLDEAFAGMEYSRVKVYNGSGLTEGKENVKGLDEKERADREKGEGELGHCELGICGGPVGEPLSQKFSFSEIVSDIKNDLKVFMGGVKDVMDKMSGVAEELQESQRIMEERQYIDKYVNEDMLGEINSRWTENMDAFKDTYGDTVFEDMKRYMSEYEITSEESVLMFLSTVGVESQYGAAITEDYNGAEAGDTVTYFVDKAYEYEVRGAGLMQVTGTTQKQFLEYLKGELENENNPQNNEKIEELQTYIDAYGTTTHYYMSDGEWESISATTCSLNATEYIAENYPIESATWFWAENEENAKITVNGNGENISINSYICNIEAKNSNNLFLVIQLMVNGRQGWNYTSLQDMALQIEDIKVEEGKIYFRDGSDAPAGWEKRNSDWNNAVKLMEGN